MENWKKFNLNYKIKVKLKDEGFTYWKQKDDLLYTKHTSLIKYVKPIEEYKNKADKEGYIEFQGWHFMELFGDAMYPSRPLLFDLNILIEEYQNS